MIGAIWPSFLTMASHVPASQGFVRPALLLLETELTCQTAQTMISYLVFWAIQFPLLFIHPTKLRPVFAVKVSTEF
jgi:cytosine/uracil/thiamine/allantoin permease